MTPSWVPWRIFCTSSRDHVGANPGWLEPLRVAPHAGGTFIRWLVVEHPFQRRTRASVIAGLIFDQALYALAPMAIERSMAWRRASDVMLECLKLSEGAYLACIPISHS